MFLCFAIAFNTMAVICFETRRRILGKPQGPKELLTQAITYMLLCFLMIALAFASIPNQ